MMTTYEVKYFELMAHTGYRFVYLVFAQLLFLFFGGPLYYLGMLYSGLCAVVTFVSTSHV